MATANLHPFVGDVPEVPLPKAPLVKVLTQVRYPRPLTFEGSATIDQTRRRLADRYPVAREGRASTLVITSEGVTQQPTPNPVWTAESLDGAWRVTLTERFVAMETTEYTSRSDFCDRLDEVLSVVAETISPVLFDRLGVRYINRLEGVEILDELPSLVQPVALAGLAVPRDGVGVTHSLCDTLFVNGDAQIQARWGWLPAGGSIDGAADAPGAPHWLLDLDVFTDTGGTFDAKALGAQARDFAERAHRFFRWTVTDEFLRRFGGQP